MMLDVGVPVRVKRMGATPTAIVVRDEGDTVRVRFVDSGRERTVKRGCIVGVRKVSSPRKLEHVPPKAGKRKRAKTRFKTPPQRSAVYLAHVRARACCICLAASPSDPHHFGPRGMGQKADDRHTVPLCRRCHDSWHAQGRVEPFNRSETEREFYRAQVDSLLAYGDVMSYDQ